MRNRLFFLIVVSSALSCSKKEEPEKMPALDRVVTVAAPAPKRLVRKTFAVQKYEAFEFEVPPNCLSPRLRGSFKSSTQGTQGHRVSNDAANIDLLLLDEQQFNDFAHGPGGNVIRSAESSYEQTINWVLNSTLQQPRKYYLVFNNSSRNPPTRFVEADFTLSFE
jgi:hypothetical protein